MEDEDDEEIEEDEKKMMEDTGLRLEVWYRSKMVGNVIGEYDHISLHRHMKFSKIFTKVLR